MKHEKAIGVLQRRIDELSPAKSVKDIRILIMAYEMAIGELKKDQ